MSWDEASETHTEIGAFIVEFLEDKGWPPTVREIGDHMGWSSPSTTHHHLHAMQAKGLLLRDPSKPRAIRVLDDQ